jgi:hypothetical protein
VKPEVFPSGETKEYSSDETIKASLPLKTVDFPQQNQLENL